MRKAISRAFHQHLRGESQRTFFQQSFFAMEDLRTRVASAVHEDSPRMEETSRRPSMEEYSRRPSVESTSTLVEAIVEDDGIEDEHARHAINPPPPSATCIRPQSATSSSACSDEGIESVRSHTGIDVCHRSRHPLTHSHR